MDGDSLKTKFEIKYCYRFPTLLVCLFYFQILAHLPSDEELKAAGVVINI